MDHLGGPRRVTYNGKVRFIGWPPDAALKAPSNMVTEELGQGAQCQYDIGVVSSRIENFFHTLIS